MEYLFSGAIIITETISLFSLFDTFLKRKNSYSIYLLMQIFYFVLMFSITNFITISGTSVLKTFIVILVSLTSSIVSYKGSLLQKIFTVSLNYILLYLTDYVASVSIMLLFNINIEEFMNSEAAYIYAAFISKTLLFLFCSILKKYLIRKSNGDILTRAEWLIMLCIPALTVFNLGFVIDNAIKRNEVTTWLVLNAIGLLIANMIIVFILEKITTETQTQSDNRILKQEIRVNLKAAQNLMNAYSLQRGMTHDFKNHLATIQVLLQNQNYQKAEQYIVALCEKSGEVIHVVNTNNASVDAILNSKYSIAKQQGILMKFNINDLSAFTIKDDDIVTILANLLDNAIEGCAKVKGEKIILVKLFSEKDNTLISIRNTSEYVEIENNSSVVSSVKNLEHGFGLNNVVKVLEIYKFTYAIEYKEGLFSFVAIKS